jgi:hypothetical protein
MCFIVTCSMCWCCCCAGWFSYLFVTATGFDTRWQQYSTHLRTNSTQNTENGTYITIKRNKLGSAGRAPSLRVIPRHLPYNWGKSTGKKNSVKVVEKCPDFPLAVFSDDIVFRHSFCTLLLKYRVIILSNRYHKPHPVSPLVVLPWSSQPTVPTRGRVPTYISCHCK